MTGLIGAGDVVRSLRGKAVWRVVEIAGQYVRVTKIEPDGREPGYVNMSYPIGNLVLVRKAGA